MDHKTIQGNSAPRRVADTHRLPDKAKAKETMKCVTQEAIAA
jgi:hypothetical protein